MPEAEASVREFVNKLRKRMILGSQLTARQTAELLRMVILEHQLPSGNQADVLIDTVKAVGEKLIMGNPTELAVGNIVKRFLHIIREEDLSLATDSLNELDLQTSAKDSSGERDYVPGPQDALAETSKSIYSAASDEGTISKKLKHGIIDAVNELIQDIDSSRELIGEKAVEYIHNNEVILTFGYSRTVLQFLRAAKEKNRSFQVFVAEGVPRYKGHVLVKKLAAMGLPTTLIADSAVFAIISRVNMVIVSAHAVFADGGVMAHVGVNMVALAAQRHAVPFVVLAGSHKLCPLYPKNPEVLLNELRSPSELVHYGEFSDLLDFRTSSRPCLHIINPTFDYVSPKLVSLFITETGAYIPTFMSRLMSDYYCADDFVDQAKAEW